MDEDNIQVLLRIRPLLPIESEISLQNILNVEGNSVILSHGNKMEQFIYDAVEGPDSSQEVVFQKLKSICDNCLQGYNGTIFAYGQTSSGKTFTMQGPLNPVTGVLIPELRGVMPRSFEYLFKEMKKQERLGAVEYLCRASFYEIYNEMIYDLLDPSTSGCTIREDLKKGVYIDGLTEEWIHSPEQAYHLLITGARNRHVAATSLNRESSRSHSVFTLILQSKVTTAESVMDLRESRFNLVDLAGSERQKLAATTGLRLKEAGNINKSLLALGNVINALVDVSNGRQRHVHYRDSKLTFLLRDSLGGNAKTFLIANVSPSPYCFAETLSTLRFAKRAKMIKNRAVVNQEFQGNILALQEEVKRLQHELLKATKTNFNEPNLNPILREWAKKLKQAEAEEVYLRQQLELHQETIRNLKQNQQADKMIIKFRDHTIQRLKEKSPTDTEEVAQLKHELAILKTRPNPDVTRFASENLELREQLTRYNDTISRLNDLEREKAELKEYEVALMDALALAVDHDEEQRRVQELEANIHALQLKHSLLQEQPKPEEIEQLMNENQKLLKQMKELESTLTLERNDHDEELKQLRLEMEELEEQSDEVLQQHQNMEIECATLEAEVEFLRQREQEEKQQMQKEREQFKEMETLYQTSVLENKQLQSRVEQLTEALSSEAEQKDLLAQHQQTVQQLEHVINENQTLKTAVEQYETNNEQLQTETQTLKQQLMDLSQKYQEESNQLMSLKKQLREKERQLEEHLNDFKAKSENILFLQERLEAANEQLNTQEDQLVQYRQESVELRSLVEVSKSENERLRLELQAQNKQEQEIRDQEMTLLEEKLGKVIQEYEHCKQQRLLECQQLKQQILHLESLANQNPELEMWREKYATLFERVKEKDALLSQQSLQFQQLESLLDSLQLEDKSASLEQQLAFLIERNQLLERENEKLVRHNNFKQKLQYHLQIKQENNQLRIENQRLLLELEKAEKQRKERRLSIK